MTADHRTYGSGPRTPSTVDPVELREWLAERFASYSAVGSAVTGHDAPLTAYDIDSVSSLLILADVEDRFGLELSTTALYEYATINDLADHIGSELGSVVSGDK